MFFQRKTKIIQELKQSFGKMKTENFNFDLIKRYHENKNHSNDFQILSDQICNDLDVDLFFCYADRTTSTIGQQYLYDKLRTINYSFSSFEHQEKVIDYLANNQKDRLEIQYQLRKLSQKQAYYLTDLFQHEPEKKPGWYFIIPLLSFSTLLSIIFSFFNPLYIFILLAILPINTLIHYSLKRKTTLFLNSIPSLLTLGLVAKSLAKFTILKPSNQEIDQSIKVISTLRRNMSFFKLEQKVDSDMEAAYWFLLELGKIIFLLEPILLFNTLKKLHDKSKVIEEIFAFVGCIDSYISIHSLRSERDNTCIPQINKSIHSIQFEEMAHPLIINCIPNSINGKKSMLLTGSNMSGKTTFIRAIGLNYISGITLNTCFATNASIPLAQLFSVIRIEDDISSSSSYFYKEMNEIKKIIDRTEQRIPSIILMDELFKGTNTRERVAASKAVLSHLSHKNNTIFVATHDIELTRMLSHEFDLFHFSEAIINSTIHFDYKLKKGIPRHGNALHILKINGFPEDVLIEANHIMNEMISPDSLFPNSDQ